MNSYSIVLFVHLCALFLAFGATALEWLALRRIRSSRVCGEALQWLGIAKSVSIAYPVALVTLVATGAYMVHSVWTWDAAWVDAGLAGIVFLGAVGDRVVGGSAKRIAGVLAADPGAPLEGRAADALRDPLFWSGALVNPLVALAVAFDMATKPGAAGAAAALAGAVAVGVAAAVPLWQSPAEKTQAVAE